MAAHHFRAGFSLWEKHGTDIIERNAGDLVNESTRGSHTFTCPALFFPTFVSSMREDLRVAALCFHLHAFGFRERLDEADEGRGEMMTRRLDQIPRETFIPKSLPIPRWSDRFARRMKGWFLLSIDREGLNTIPLRWNGCNGSILGMETFGSANFFLQ